MQITLLMRYFDLSDTMIEYLSNIYVRNIFIVQNMKIRNVRNTVAINESMIGENGDSFKIDAIFSGARISAIEKVITYTGAIVIRPIAVEV